jgi:hypothetical protein
MSNVANAAATNRANARPSGGNNLIVSVIVIVLVLVGLYYLYQFLYGTPSSQATVTILSAPTSASTINSPDVIATNALTGILDGGAYTMSMWVYINNTVGFATTAAPLAHLFDIGNTPPSTGAVAGATYDTMLFVGLNPINGSLIVRQSTSDTAAQINNNMAAGATSTGTNYSLNTLISNYNTGDTYTKDDRCDILNGIEYQRWILITVVANGRTLDVYIDGKLSRSCVYKANYALLSAAGTATASVGSRNGGKLKGFFSNIKYSNYAFTPDAIWSQYQSGPGEPFSVTNFFNNLFGTNVSFGSSSAFSATSTAPVSS